MLRPLAKAWTAKVSVGMAPHVVYYFRDGVSEGQYSHVAKQEVESIRKVLNELAPKTEVKITALICSKRHHIRFFPVQGQGDRNQNPLPGTLVETHVTHTRENDYYLCAHSAIKGTARPVHYHTLIDEQNLKPEEIQNMIYEASYQYVRSTTPVSLFPAIYYAHLAAARGNNHVNSKVDSGPKTTKVSSSHDPNAPVDPLLPLRVYEQGDSIEHRMWFV